MSFVLSSVVSDLEWLNDQCMSRRLHDGAKWSAEMLINLPESEEAATPSVSLFSDLSVKEQRVLRLSQACIDCQEFDRAAKLLEPHTKNSFLAFLHFYSRYLGGEKRKLDNTADVNDKKLQFENENVSSLHRDLEKVNQNGTMDCYLRYIYGLVLSHLDLKEEAELAFIQCISGIPLWWPAWVELSKIVSSRDHLTSLKLPEHWMKELFSAEVYGRLQLHRDSLDIYSNLKSNGFDGCSYVLTGMAVASHNLQGMKVELAALAHHCFDVNKFCPETCSVVGNYYSLRGDHERAVLYFQRALKLDPQNAGAWTLMGHEFMELKNTSAACLAYHHALEIDKRDYRAWYGLGQMYDILRMPHYATYYYNLAHKSRPQDSRMIIALGDMYQKQSRMHDALKCFWKAHCVGDIEGQALVRLGKLFEKENDSEQAATCYLKFLHQLEQQEVTDIDNQPTCYRFLAEYFLNKNQYDEGHYYGQLCLEYDVTKEDGKGILKRISQVRNDKQLTDDSSMQIDANSTSLS